MKHCVRTVEFDPGHDRAAHIASRLGHVLGNTRLRSNLYLVRNVKVSGDTYLPAEHAAVPDVRRTRDAELCGSYGILADYDVVADLDQVIELGAGFDPELTARENIYLNGSLLGYTKEFIDANFDGIIDFAELNDFVDMPLKNFSSGMVARIAFAIATITEPDILIVDETLSVGDVFFQEKCERRIQHFIESGDVTVLFVSHSMDQVERICQRAVWIEKGDLRMDGPVDAVCKAYRDQFN